MNLQGILHELLVGRRILPYECGWYMQRDHQQSHSGDIGPGVGIPETARKKKIPGSATDFGSRRNDLRQPGTTDDLRPTHGLEYGLRVQSPLEGDAEHQERGASQRRQEEQAEGPDFVVERGHT